MVSYHQSLWISIDFQVVDIFAVADHNFACSLTDYYCSSEEFCAAMKRLVKLQIQPTLCKHWHEYSTTKKTA
jgi:hypothetical protein